MKHVLRLSPFQSGCLLNCNSMNTPELQPAVQVCSYCYSYIQPAVQAVTSRQSHISSIKMCQNTPFQKENFTFSVGEGKEWEGKGHSLPAQIPPHPSPHPTSIVTQLVGPGDAPVNEFTESNDVIHTTHVSMHSANGALHRSTADGYFSRPCVQCLVMVMTVV